MIDSYSLAKKLFFKLDAETSHSLALGLLKRLHPVMPGRTISKPVELMGLTFPNRVGLAAGLDKDGDYIDGLAKFGFGHIEVGTTTPRPQSGNPKPRLFRLAEHNAIINRMGFNNKGVDYLVNQVKSCRYDGILGINIGKNKDTPNEKAIDDYRVCFEKVYAHASYVTINVSSPNTPGLRDLQASDELKSILDALFDDRESLKVKHGRQVPVVVKIAPDLTDEQIAESASVFSSYPVDGVIATNTTITRDQVKDSPHVNEAGGLSGAPLTEMSTTVISKLRSGLDKSTPIIGVGGILSADDAKTKLSAGADLVQLYTGLIYQGPKLVKQVAEAL